jgi:hypothetical protein
MRHRRTASEGVEALILELFRARLFRQIVIETWRRHYNEVRPHSSLENLKPHEFKQRLSKQSLKGAMSHYPMDRRKPAGHLVEQVIATGSGLNGIDCMAAGLPTISNLEDDTYIVPMIRWSYFGLCSVVSASPENLIDFLRKDVTRPELRQQLGRTGKECVGKYHRHHSAQYIFNNVIDYFYGHKDSLINLYHSLLGVYQIRSPTIQHSLVNNRIFE